MCLRLGCDLSHGVDIALPQAGGARWVEVNLTVGSSQYLAALLASLSMAELMKEATEGSGGDRVVAADVVLGDQFTILDISSGTDGAVEIDVCDVLTGLFAVDSDTVQPVRQVAESIIVVDVQAMLVAGQRGDLAFAVQLGVVDLLQFGGPIGVIAVDHGTLDQQGSTGLVEPFNLVEVCLGESVLDVFCVKEHSAHAFTSIRMKSARLYHLHLCYKRRFWSR